jgi:transcriptional regulator with XRE-family HTH domain
MELRVNHQPALAARLRTARDAANLSQAELADLLGVSTRTVQYWEAGKVPRPKHRRLILAFLESEEEVAAA